MENNLLKEIIRLLEDVNNDDCTPKLVKIKIKGIYENLLNEEKPVCIRVDKSLQELDEMGEESNIPIHIKTQIWDIVSKLESIPQ